MGLVMLKGCSLKICESKVDFSIVGWEMIRIGVEIESTLEDEGFALGQIRAIIRVGFFDLQFNSLMFFTNLSY